MPAPSSDVAPNEYAPHVAVLGAGVSGLAAAERLVRASATVRVTVLESSHRLGGMIHTERTDDGYTFEVGADSVVASKPATAELCARLGIADRLHGPSTRGAYVYRRGRLRRLPAGLSGLMPTRLAPLATSGVLSPLGVARVALEPWQPARRPAPGDAPADESLEGFVVRRMGREAYERLVEPLLTGIYGGDGAALSLAATFPQLGALEREHGSLLHGLRARRATPAPASPFLSLPTGLSELIDALERALVATGRVRILRNTPARALRRTSTERRAVVLAARTSAGADERVTADAVIVATPAPVAARLLADVDAPLAAELDGIAHGSTATVTLAYAAADVPHPLDGTGYVVPRAEGRAVMACTWLSSKWAGRTPPGTALFRLFLGGAHRPDLLDAHDADLVALARAELHEVLGVRGTPRLQRVARWTHAMPQYALGHPARIARVAERVAEHPWLALAGNAYQGVGIPDCIRSGEAAADRVLRHLVEHRDVRAPGAAPRAAA